MAKVQYKLGQQSRRRDLVGDGLTALCGGALALNLLLVVALLWILLANGAGHFWQRPLVQLEIADASPVLGEIHERELRPDDANRTDQGDRYRVRVKVGNRDLSGEDFVWVDEEQIVSRTNPEQAVLLERREWGNFYGTPQELHLGENILAKGPERVWPALKSILSDKLEAAEAIHEFEQGQIADINYQIDKIRRREKKLALSEISAAERDTRTAALLVERNAAESEYEALASELFAMRDKLMSETVVFSAANGERQEIAIGNIVRAIQPNQSGFIDRVTLYASRVHEFIFAAPRESNTEGGIFPAIFGTVMMVFIMSFAVAPFGILAALYLREYAKQGLMVRIVRIAVNNLAGVPSIVFGVFGLGFFVYVIGGNIDRIFYPESLPTPTFGTGGILWGSLTLALLTVPVVIVATEEGLASVPRIVRQGSRALGATKFETTWRVVIPAAAPGILTGLILAMARAAGEVAPLMIVGMVKLAPTLPIDGHFPFFHLERKFMHLGFHIYDVGFQSPNVEATKPLVFATALLLIGVVTLMNLVAIFVRNHLANKYATSAV
jgi:phosphate transport system permease protein